MKKKKDFPCECGHPFKEHVPEDAWEFASCTTCYKLVNSGFDCKLVRGVHYNWVHEFKADNLAYIEQQYEQRKK